MTRECPASAQVATHGATREARSSDPRTASRARSSGVSSTPCERRGRPRPRHRPHEWTTVVGERSSTTTGCVPAPGPAAPSSLMRPAGARKLAKTRRQTRNGGTRRVVKRRRMRAKREGADSTRRAGPLYRNARAAAGVRHQPPVRHVCAPSLRPGLRASVDSQRAHHKYARGSCRPLRPCDQNAACRLACSISCLATWTSSATANRGRGGQRCGRRRAQRSSAATTLVF